MNTIEFQEYLIENFPLFKKRLNESAFVRDDGSFSFYGLFAEFSQFFKIYYLNLNHNNLIHLFQLIEKSFIEENDNSNRLTCIDDETLETINDFNDAACTCFLENIASEGLTSFLNQYLGEKSLNFYIIWDSNLI